MEISWASCVRFSVIFGALGIFISCKTSGPQPPDTDPADPTRPRVGFKARTHLYEFEPLPGQPTGSPSLPLSHYTLTVEDWNGCRIRGDDNVFLAQDTIDTREVIDAFEREAEPALSDAKVAVERKPNGTISFGGMRFPGGLYTFTTRGVIKDQTKAFGLLNRKESAAAEAKNGVLVVDAPVPVSGFSHNTWKVTVIYAGRVTEHNAAEHNDKERKLVWTSEASKENRIRFKMNFGE